MKDLLQEGTLFRLSTEDLLNLGVREVVLHGVVMKAGLSVWKKALVRESWVGLCGRYRMGDQTSWGSFILSRENNDTTGATESRQPPMGIQAAETKAIHPGSKRFGDLVDKCARWMRESQEQDQHPLHCIASTSVEGKDMKDGVHPNKERPWDFGNPLQENFDPPPQILSDHDPGESIGLDIHSDKPGVDGVSLPQAGENVGDCGPHRVNDLNPIDSNNRPPEVPSSENVVEDSATVSAPNKNRRRPDVEQSGGSKRRRGKRAEVDRLLDSLQTSAWVSPYSPLEEVRERILFTTRVPRTARLMAQRRLHTKFKSVKKVLKFEVEEYSSDP